MHHHDHNHASGDISGIKAAFFINLVFTLFEIIGGLTINSVAILSDALHDLGDSFSLGLAWFLANYSERGGDEKYSYGYRRF
jgi:cobalt-zinc-cadmium efflux system protein